MIFKLKAPILVVLVSALVGLGAAGVQASEFHCSVEPCKYVLNVDEAAGTKTAHHVIIIENPAGESIAFTCNQLTGSSVFLEAKTTSSIFFGNLAYDQCFANGSAKAEVRMNECDYGITSLGTIALWACNSKKEMEIEIPETKCLFKIPEQDFAAGSFSFHNTGSKSLITMEAFLGGIRNMVVTSTSTKAQCGINISLGPLTGTYTTGNTIFTGQTAAGVMASVWWE